MTKYEWVAIVDVFTNEDGSEGGYLKVKPSIDEYDDYGLFTVCYNNGDDDMYFAVEHDICERDLYINDENPCGFLCEYQVKECLDIFYNFKDDILECIVYEILLKNSDLCMMAMSELADELI